MTYGGSNVQETHGITLPRKVKLVTPICLECNISNSWRWYLATIAKYYCCEAVRSAILVTAWFLVFGFIKCNLELSDNIHPGQILSWKWNDD